MPTAAPQQNESRPPVPDDEPEIDRAKLSRYLLARGWKKVSLAEAPAPAKRWLDPETGKPSETRLVREDRIANTVRQIKQTFSNAPAWYYTLTEAVLIQQQRENPNHGQTE